MAAFQSKPWVVALLCIWLTGFLGIVGVMKAVGKLPHPLVRIRSICVLVTYTTGPSLNSYERTDLPVNIYDKSTIAGPIEALGAVLQLPKILGMFQTPTSLGSSYRLSCVGCYFFTAGKCHQPSWY